MRQRRSRWWFLALSALLLASAATTCGSQAIEPAPEPDLTGKTHDSAADGGAEPDATRPASAPHTLDTWALWSGGTQLRGANLYQRRVYPELDGPEFMGPGPVGPPYSQQDLDRLAAMGANYVNISHPGLFAESAPFELDPDMQANLDRLLDMAARADVFAVISFRTGPGRSEFTFVWEEVGDWFEASYLDDSVWQDQAAQDAWVAMWQYTAQRYRDHPIVAGYDLMVEPNSNEVGSHALDDPLDVWDPEEFVATYGGSLYDWNQLYPRLSDAIREVDRTTPLLIGGLGYSAVEWLTYLEPTGDPRTVYTVHQYAPHRYTHQSSDSVGCSYPGRCDLDWDGDPSDPLDRAWLEQLMVPIDQFSAAHGAPVAVNEFGAVRWAPGVEAYLDDLLDLFELRGMNYALWVWDPAWEPWAQEVDAFNFRHGPDPENHIDLGSSALLEVVRSYWQRNSVRPTSWADAEADLQAEPGDEVEGVAPLPLTRVLTWAYQLQGLNAPGAVEALADSAYDMLVLEPTRTDWSSDDRRFNTRAMIKQLKGSRAGDGVHRKLVLAYANIGEAEDWRWYWAWSSEWSCRGRTPADWPDYILGCDPDGWGGNYPVAYWDPQWKDIVVYGRTQSSAPYGDYASVLDEILRDGFDGIYLDWVEGYEDERVDAAARAEGRDPAAEMVALVNEIKAYAAARRPGFLVVQQNAAALVEMHPELVHVIDGIAQEGIWYDGDATDDWDDGEGYDLEIDPELTNDYLNSLGIYLDAGLPVFNCEYALDYAEEAYAHSHAQGFVPYVTRSSLSRLTTTPPPSP